MHLSVHSPQYSGLEIVTRESPKCDWTFVFGNQIFGGHTNSESKLLLSVKVILCKLAPEEVLSPAGNFE